MNNVLLVRYHKSNDEADRSRWHDVTSATGWMASCRYRGAVPWRQYCCTPELTTCRLYVQERNRCKSFSKGV